MKKSFAETEKSVAKRQESSAIYKISFAEREKPLDGSKLSTDNCKIPLDILPAALAAAGSFSLSGTDFGILEAE